MRAHVQGKSHRSKSQAATALGAEEIDNLPEYVDVNVAKEGELRCMLCNNRTTLLSTMQAHLSSEKHAKACQRAGYPELTLNAERGRLEKKETGEPVSCTAEADFQPAPLPRKRRSPRKPRVTFHEDDPITPPAMTDLRYLNDGPTDSAGAPTDSPVRGKALRFDEALQS